MFIKLGNSFNSLEFRLNQYFLNIKEVKEFKPKKITDNLAIEKGLDYFYEIIFYSVLIGVPLLEMVKNQKENEHKTTAVKNKVCIFSNIKVFRNSTIKYLKLNIHNYSLFLLRKISLKINAKIQTKKL